MKIAGVMSGSSLDGVDMAVCSFASPGEYTIQRAVTIPIPSSLKENLAHANFLSVKDFLDLEGEWGVFLSKALNEFLRSENSVDLIVSHGHTIYHAPDKNISCQIGNGGILAMHTGVPVLCDLRIQDIAIGGQGAPLAAVADKYLFSDYDILVNLGGIMNVSVRHSDENLQSWDVGPCNQYLNYLANERNMDYDINGDIAKTGKLLTEMIDKWNSKYYFNLSPPKSLDNTWVQTHFCQPENEDFRLEDRMHTAVYCIARQLYQDVNPYVGNKPSMKILLTGGGAHNKYLVESIKDMFVMNNVDIQVPSTELIDYKEALLMAYMGYLYLHKLPNTVSTATGAVKDIIAGALYLN